eukprot:6262951-Prymnesium_polylepis.1
MPSGEWRPFRSTRNVAATPLARVQADWPNCLQPEPRPFCKPIRAEACSPNCGLLAQPAD